MLAGELLDRDHGRDGVPGQDKAVALVVQPQPHVVRLVVPACAHAPTTLCAAVSRAVRAREVGQRVYYGTAVKGFEPDRHGAVTVRKHRASCQPVRAVDVDPVPQLLLGRRLSDHLSTRRRANGRVRARAHGGAGWLGGRGRACM